MLELYTLVTLNTSIGLILLVLMAIKSPWLIQPNEDRL